MPNIKLISIGLIVLFWLAFARTPVVLVTALTSTLSPALVNAENNDGQVKTTKISCRAPVHQTGQTKCHDEKGGLIDDCKDSRQDGEKKKGAKLPNPRFTDNDDGTVTDNLTGLIWLKNANCFEKKTWTEALKSANDLYDSDPNNVNDCGLSDRSNLGDWRLPNVKELQSLVNYGFANPALSNAEGTAMWTPRDPFDSVKYGGWPNYYWSSSTDSDEPESAWYVILGNGSVGRFSKTDNLYVWPVRGGQ